MPVAYLRARDCWLDRDRVLVETEDSVAEKIIVERADLGTRIKFLYMKRRCRLHKRARLCLSSLV